MLIGILGPLTIVHDGTPVTLNGGKRRLLLTLLAAASPGPVSTERIAGTLWGESASASAGATLQTYVYQLRKLLGTEVVLTTPGGYALAGCEVDARRFEALVRAVEREGTDTRRRRLTSALQLWRGEPFAEFPDVPDLAAERTRLVELRLAAIADRIDDDLALGHHDVVVAELEALVAEHPLRERFWAQLMIALYRSDRQAEALRAYGRLRRHLRDEVGVSPGRALATLEQQILTHDPGLQIPPAGESTSARLAGRRAILEVAGDAATPGRRVRYAAVEDAVAEALREAARDPGARMAIHVGEVSDDDGDMTDTVVDRATRVGAAARSGQILLTAAAKAALAGGDLGDLNVVDLGMHRLRAAGQAERLYELAGSGLAPEPAPADGDASAEGGVFVGRQSEIAHVLARVRRLRSGPPGGVIMLVGEAGIGKTATAAQIALSAAAEGAVVLRGRCVDGPWATPYGAVMEAIAGHLRNRADDDPDSLGPETLEEVRSLLPSNVAAVAAHPGGGEESDAREVQLRTLVTIGRFVAELASLSPVVILLDDLHWADDGTIAAVRHLARDSVDLPVLLLGTYRDDEVDAEHPLRTMVATMSRESRLERVRLRGLGAQDVIAIASAVTGVEVEPGVAEQIALDTAGNPFFVHQVIRQPRGDVPGTVVDVVAHRVRRLSSSTQQLLRTACVFEADFPFTVAATVAGLGEDEALDALDGALDAYLMVAGELQDTYRFVHALAREAIAAELNPSRRIRLHRRAAEALSATVRSNEMPADVAGQIAGHYHRSRSLPGAEAGVPPALVAADHATDTGALEQAVELCRAAVELVPAGSAEHAELLGRLGLALARAAHADEAIATIGTAIEAIASAYGPDRAADYAVEAWHAGAAGLEGLDERILARGLALAGDRRDLTWAYLYVLVRSPDDLAERLQDELFAKASRLIMGHTGNPGIGAVLSHTHPTRQDVLTLDEWPSARLFGAGDLRSTVVQFHEAASGLERAGRLLSAAKQRLYEAVAETCLGNLDRASGLLDGVTDGSLPFTPSNEVRDRILFARYLLCSARDSGWRALAPHQAYRDADERAVPLAWADAKVYARRGDRAAAAAAVERAVPYLPTAVEANGFTDRLEVHDFIEALWLAELDQHLALAGRLVDERLVHDLRGPMSDMRLCKARLAALGGDPDQAMRWFAESRAVLDEAGARPLRAIVDFDEALLHRRLAGGDDRRCADLLDDAIHQFGGLGMSGWLRRAERLACLTPDR